MQPDGSSVAVVSGSAVAVDSSAARGIESAWDAVLSTARRSVLRAVTVDLSPILLDAVLRSPRELPQVAVVRIVPRAASDPVLARSPADPVERLVSHRFTVPGGHDLLGNELRPLDDDAVAAVCDALSRTDVRHVAVVSAGSQARPQHERAVADAIQAAVGGARISIASDFGGQGLVAREATVVLDAAVAPLVDAVLTRWERTLACRAPEVQLRVARGDGGFSTPPRLRAMPLVALGATDAAILCGAAHLAGRQDCRVLLPRPAAQLAGDVRRGLPVLRSAQLLDFGTELVVPTAVLAPDPGCADQHEATRVTDLPVVLADRDPAELACVGVAVSQPTAWLDEVAFIESAAQLDGVRRDAEQRAAAIVMANGAVPGTTYLIESSIVAVPYSPSGTVRIRVRVAGSSDLDARVEDRAAVAL
jgi:Hydantoinase/oxoprolinase N-terminal region